MLHEQVLDSAMSGAGQMGEGLCVLRGETPFHSLYAMEHMVCGQ